MNDARPVLVANLGNTHLRLVYFAGGTTAWDRRFATGEAPGWALPDLPDEAGVVLVSVVPEAAAHVRDRYGPDRVMSLGADTVDLPIAYQPPGALGADRLANAVAIAHTLGWGIAVDLGTATTLTVVDRTGTLVGGAIMPGLATAAASLSRGTAQLPAVEPQALAAPWGDGTHAAIQIGLVHGHVGAVTHLVGRMRQALPEAPVVITGGWSRFFAPLLPADYRLEPDLTIHGARLAWEAHAARRP